MLCILIALYNLFSPKLPHLIFPSLPKSYEFGGVNIIISFLIKEDTEPKENSIINVRCCSEGL